MMANLTEQVHQELRQHLKTGDVVIDATAGNGYDTTFLASVVGIEGKVFAFDIQDQAIDNTRQKLVALSLNQSVVLIKACHSLLLQNIPACYTGNIQCIIFNLGYLPGSDKSCITRAATTLQALEQSIELLADNGLLSIMLYPGHEGGQQESEKVLKWIDQLPDNYRITREITPGPQWYLILKNSTRD